MQYFTRLLIYTFCTILSVLVNPFYNVSAQEKSQTKIYTRQDTLRGTNGIGRSGWDVLHYDITVQPNIATKTITGKNSIYFAAINNNKLQIDLQEPMMIDSIIIENTSCTFSREANVYWVNLPASDLKLRTMDIYFHGKPKEAINPPWDGGWVWKQDNNNNPWISLACQGIGASVWYPCKDIQSDKADSGATLRIIVPDSLKGIGNGRLISTKTLSGGLTEYIWEVKSPINNYNIVPYIGKYIHYGESVTALKGKLDINYWVLEYNLKKAIPHFTDALYTIKAFEYWMGPYPFYRDGYKLVEAPYLGMEHQSAIAYGNEYNKGYLGRDLSETGWGLKFDFIIVHESGHEWFGNSITSKDIADMWIHESFTNYSEVLYTDYRFGRIASNEYVIGLRNNIKNDKPIIASYGVNEEGSGDMYYKGANMLHIIRQLVNNDSLFRVMLIGLNKKFYHSTVTTAQIENYIIKKTSKNLSSIFNQYLRTTKIPLLEYSIQKKCIKYRWKNVVKNFHLPIKISAGETTKKIWIIPSEKWQSLKIKEKSKFDSLKVDENFYVESKKIE